MANTVINTPELLNLDSTTGATILAKGTISERPTTNAIDGALRFNTDTNKTEYYDGTGWYEIVDEYASGFIGPATNYFDTKLYTGNGATQSIGGYINGSGSFNGSSSKVVLPVGLGDNGDRTRSMWIKVGELPSSGSDFFFYIGNQGANDDYETLRVNSSGNIQLQERNDAGGSGDLTLTSSITLNVGQWYHIAYVFSGTSRKLYINNSTTDGATGTKSGGTVDNSSFASNLGQFRTLTPSYDGSIDQVRIYGTALSSSDVTALYSETAATATTAAFPSGQTAIATYTMDTSANGLLNTQDLSTVNYPAGAGCMALYEMNGNSNDTSGTYNGTPTSITYQGGAFDQAAVFNGSSSYIDTGFSVYNKSVICLSAWINVDDLSSTQMFFGSTCSSGCSFGGQVNTNGTIRFRITDGTEHNATTSNTISAGQWYNIVCVWDKTIDSGELKIYIDGTEASYSTQQSQTNNTTENVSLRLGRAASTYFNGSIDQVRIYSTALTQSQVTTLARGIATSYSGAATNVNFNGHLDFAPDFVWIKERTGSAWHIWTDIVRGANKTIYSNDAYQQESLTNVMNSFDNNGFTVGYNSAYSSVFSNKNNEDYVSWNWKAGGTAVPNNDGTIPSQVSANKDSGFSIVKYTGNATAGAKIGHGLSSAPDLIIVKLLDATKDWYVFSELLGQSGGEYQFLELNDSPAANTFNIQQVWNGVLPTSDVFTLTGGSADNSNNNDYIAYCFHSVALYSKIGTYEGNGTTATTTITTGFKPSWVMIKRTDSTNNWVIYDDKRDTTSPLSERLFADTSGVESDGGTTSSITISPTGFSMTTSQFGGSINTDGGQYLYMAFA
jgi:hypothetical protein